MAEDTSSVGLSPDVREQLRQHFSGPTEEHGTKWDALWVKGDFLPWDRGEPNPALVDTLAERQDIIGGPLTAGAEPRRKRALVPGCGKGYDVLLLASFGYDAYGLEVSSSAVKACENLAKSEYARHSKPGADNGPGSFQFIHGDFYKDDWLKEAGLEPGAFDLIYDYTFFCAMPPQLRPAWSSRMAQLLSASTDAHLICLEFPTYKPPSTDGPPWGVDPNVYVSHLSYPGAELSYSDEGYPKEEFYTKDSDVSVKATAPPLLRVAHWQPERTHPVGKGTDWVSIWQHKQP